MSKLPKGWLNQKLGDVVDYGKTIKVEPNVIDNNAWILELEDIEKGSSRLNQRLFFAHRKSKSTKNKFSKGDVLYGKLRPYLDKVIIADEGGYCSTEIIPIKPGAYIDSRYLFYSLKRKEFLEYVESVSHGLSMPRLGTKQGKNAPFILAPLNEQIRIADKLDSILAKVNKAQARIDKIPKILERFRKSVLAAATSGELTKEWRKSNNYSTSGMLEGFTPLKKPNRYKSRNLGFIQGVIATAVGKPKESLVNSWQWVPLVDIATMSSGHTPSRSKPEYWGGDICWLGIKDARKNHTKTITDTAQKTNELGLSNSAARFIPKNTICISRTASVGYVTKLGKDMVTSQDFVNWTPSEVISADWLKWLFVAEKESLFRFGKGSTHTTVYFPEWLSIHVALPPIEEQTEIVRRVESLFTLADTVEKQYHAIRKNTDRLTQSLLAKAFRGELVPQDENDEPAGELLTRIKEQAELLKPRKKAKK